MELTPEANAAVDKYCKSRSIQKKYAVQKVLTWWGEQDDTLKGLILDLVRGPDKKALARQCLERLANPPPSDRKRRPA